MAKKQPTDALLKELRAFGLTYPGAHTKSPWPGHLDLAVKDKTFAFLSVEGDPFSISCKLPGSGAIALLMPFAEPTPYGLGKSGWVSARFPPDQLPDLAMLKAWVDESYRAQAPKKLLAQLDALRSSPGAAGIPAKGTTGKTAKRSAKPAAKKPAARSSATKARSTAAARAASARSKPAQSRATKTTSAKARTRSLQKAARA
jgi:hypothetical protein